MPVYLHCMQLMAVKDRVDCSLSDKCHSVDIASECLADVLQTESYLYALKENLTILTSRFVRMYMPFFESTLVLMVFLIIQDTLKCPASQKW